MAITIEIPGGSAVLLEGQDLSNKDVKKLRRTARSLMTIRGKLDEANTTNTVTPDDEDDEEKKILQVLDVLDDDEIDDLDLFQRACVVVCLESWTLDTPLPETVEEVDALKPRLLYKVLTTEASKVNLSEEFGMEGAADPKADTESSSS